MYVSLTPSFAIISSSMVSKYATWTTEVHHNDLVLVEDVDVALHHGGNVSWVGQLKKASPNKALYNEKSNTPNAGLN